MQTDHELLNAYARTGSENSFKELFERYRGMVLSVCLRMLSDETLAEEGVQAVFVLLARKAGTIAPKAVIAGWLYQAAIYTARHLQRSAVRRVMHEAKAADMKNRHNTDMDKTWADLAPELDEAVMALSPRYRDAIVLHYFEGIPQHEAARQAGCAPKAFQKRVARALEALRAKLGRRGVVLGAAVLAACLAENASASTAVFGFSASAGSALLAKSVAKTMLWIKLKFAAAAVAAAAVAASAAVPAALSVFSDDTPRNERVICGLNRAADRDALAWDPAVEVELTGEHATEGPRAARVTFPARDEAGRYSGFRLPSGLTRGWDAYETFAFDVFNPDDQPVVIEMRLDDNKVDRGNYRTWHTSFCRVVPGANRFEIRLDSLTANNQRPLDSAAITEAAFWGLTPEKTTLYFDNFVLKRTPGAYRQDHARSVPDLK